MTSNLSIITGRNVQIEVKEYSGSGLVMGQIEINSEKANLNDSTLRTTGKSTLVAETLISNASTRFDGDGDWHISTKSEELNGQVYISGQLTLELKGDEVINNMIIHANKLVVIYDKELRSTKEVKINHFERISP